MECIDWIQQYLIILNEVFLLMVSSYSEIIWNVQQAILMKGAAGEGIGGTDCIVAEK